MRRVAIVLAGGAGERFWPLSRRNKPKQFLRLAPERPTLLQETIDRLKLLLPASEIYVVTGAHLVEITRQSLRDVPPENVLAEPAKRNTAGAIAFAAATLGEDVCMGIFPADHTIGNPDAFARVARVAYSHAEASGDLVTIGIQPTRPETAYGYIETAQTPSGERAKPVRAFHEKPSAAVAEAYVADGKHLWNAGMFFWTAAAFSEELQAVDQDYFSVLHSGSFEMLPSISIDHLLLERSSKVAVVKGDFDWDDVGSLDALARFSEPDPDGNRLRGEIVSLGSSGNLVINESDEVAVSLVGVSDLIVVTTGDAVLICHKDKVQSLREVVTEIDRRGLPQV